MKQAITPTKADLEGIVAGDITFDSSPKNLAKKASSFFNKHKTTTFTLLEGASTLVAMAYGMVNAINGDGSAGAGVETSLRVFGVRAAADVALLWPYYALNKSDYGEAMRFLRGDAVKMLSVKQGVNLLTLPLSIGALSGMNSANVPTWLGFAASGKITIPATIMAKLWLFNRFVLNDKDYKLSTAVQQTGHQMNHSVQRAYCRSRKTADRYVVKPVLEMVRYVNNRVFG